MSLAAISPLMLSTALLATLSWLGFIVAGFVLWSNGNTNGGYSMVGIAIILPAVVAALAQAVRALRAQQFSNAQLVSVTWLSALSWLGFIVCGFVLWSFGNTDGGYSMVGIATSLPFVVAAVLGALSYYHPLLVTAQQLTYTAPRLLTMTWAGFIVSGFMLWYYGNLSGGYAMVGIAICLPAVVAAALLVHTLCARAGVSGSVVSVFSWLGTLSWSGFLVAGFMLWYYGNTTGGYAMVGIAIVLPAVVATYLSFSGFKALEPVVPSVVTPPVADVRTPEVAVVAESTSVEAAAAADIRAVVADTGVVV